MKYSGRVYRGLIGIGAFFCVLLLVFAGVVSALLKDPARIETLIKRDIVRRTPSLAKARIEITFKDTKDLSGSQEQDYKIAYPENLSLAGDIVIPIDIYVNAELKRRVNLRTSIRIFQKVVVSSSTIRKGDVISPKNIEYAEKDVTHLPPSFITDMDKAVGKRASTFIPKGALVLDWMPKDVPAIRAGETVDLFKSINGIFVKVKAVAVEDGYINGNIRVKNTSSNKVVEGKVRSTGEVEAI